MAAKKKAAKKKTSKKKVKSSGRDRPCVVNCGTLKGIYKVLNKAGYYPVPREGPPPPPRRYLYSVTIKRLGPAKS
jgi:hypothetical protein